MPTDHHAGPDQLSSVVVAVCTYRRPEGLARVIPHLEEQARSLTDATARVVVVDNDPVASARQVFADVASEKSTYLHEDRPGISAARNRCLDEAAGADAIVFIDDDETPDEGWLQHLVDAWRRWGCAAVSGPVTSVFEGEVDDWVLASGVFDRAVRESGSLRPGASSANLLLDLAVLRRLNLRFDEDFGLSGGSDTMLAHALRDRGGQIRWCQEAGVTEYVPGSRTRRDWVVRRTVRTSNTWARAAVALAPTRARRLVTRAELATRGGYRVARGLTARGAARFTGDVARDARGAVDMASGRGLLLGAAGVVRVEYGRPATPPAHSPD